MRMTSAWFPLAQTRTRRLESLFDKYVISADMTYTKLLSCSTLITFVVTTSYNIGLHGIKSPFDMNLTLMRSLTTIQGCVPAKKRLSALLHSGMVVFKIPKLKYIRSNLAQYQSSKSRYLKANIRGSSLNQYERALKMWHFGIRLVCRGFLFVES